MDRKGIAIIVACVLFLIAWQFYIVPNYFPEKEPAAPQGAETAEQEPQPEMISPAPPTGSETETEEPEHATPAETAVPVKADRISVQNSGEEPRYLTLQNSVMSLTMSTRGAAMKSLSLKNFTNDNGDPLVLLDSFSDDVMPLNMKLIRPDIDLHLANYSVRNGHGSATFTASASNGLTVSKEVAVTPDKYDFTFKISFSNNSPAPMEFIPEITGPGSITQEDRRDYYIRGAVEYLKNGPEHASPKPGKRWQVPREIVYEGVSTTDIDLVYIGVRNRFFGAAILPEESLLVRGLVALPVEKETDGKDKEQKKTSLTTGIVMAPVRLEPGETREFTFTFYAGPKKADILAEYGPLSNLLDYGMFSAISKLLLILLRFFYGITRNYGVAIILMTIIVKTCLFPLSRKSSLSQAKQQKLAPQIKAIQEQYKGNKQKLHEETMKLYKQEGVNPLGGCLPVLLQIPVFIGLLRLLQYSIELRQAVFIPGWIDDLSKADTIAILPQSIPLIGGGNLNLLPLIMGSVSILHQKMMPKPADPQAQQQMMMMRFMPLMFVFLLYNWPSGLLLYWTMSSGISVLEQYLLRKHVRK